MAATAAKAVTAIELPMVLAAPLNGVMGEVVGLLTILEQSLDFVTDKTDTR